MFPGRISRLSDRDSWGELAAHIVPRVIEVGESGVVLYNNLPDPAAETLHLPVTGHDGDKIIVV